jgi:hypothetical protein
MNLYSYFGACIMAFRRDKLPDGGFTAAGYAALVVTLVFSFYLNAISLFLRRNEINNMDVDFVTGFVTNPLIMFGVLMIIYIPHIFYFQRLYLSSQVLARYDRLNVGRKRLTQVVTFFICGGSVGWLLAELVLL